MTSPAAFERLKQIVVARTGHHYYVDKDKLLLERVRERMQASGTPTLEAYLALLETGNPGEWRFLEDAITIGETYFFRYPDHFADLRNVILPRLIAARRASRHLRIWSIGCANGAEPYSLAIVLRELLGAEVDDWQIALIGGDISEKALASARAGRFTAWALRTMGPEDRVRYFDQQDAAWIIKPEFRRMVRFERQNILDLLSPTPPLEWSGIDLILCRNVLIYFSMAQAVEITRALRERVSPDGALILGHAEATLATDPALMPAPVLPSEFGQALAPLEPVATPVIPRRPAPISQPTLEGIAIPSPTPDIEEVQRLADAGAYEQAHSLCRALMAISPTSVRLQYYDAILRQVSDDAAGAEAALRRAIYLDRNFVLAHHRLGMLLLASGRTAEARRSLLAAAKLAEKSPADAALPEGQGVLAGEFVTAVRRQIGTAA